MSAMFELINVSAGYGGEPVVRDVTMGVNEGEFCALLGLNGSGKTTLLKAVCGLLPLYHGGCYVNGLDCSNFNERKRAGYISLIPQRFSEMRGVTVLDAVLMGLNPHLSVFEYPSKAQKLSAAAVLERLGVLAFAERDFAGLSEGQKQLVILARTIVQNAPVTLMDEPDSALDFVNRHRILAKVREIIRTEKKAGIITIHDPNFALAYCDRLMLMESGRVVSELSLDGANCENIHQCLTKIYGNIDVLEHNGKFIMLKH